MSKTSKIFQAIEKKYPGCSSANPHEIEALAIEFPNAVTASFLGSSFDLDGRFYGLVSLRHNPKAKAFDTVIAACRTEYQTKKTLHRLPVEVQKRLKTSLGESSESYWDDVRSRHYSNLDLQYGTTEMGPTVRNRLKKGGSCEVFWGTEGALAQVLKLLTPGEKIAWDLAMGEYADKLIEEFGELELCAERPYFVYLYGTDDFSWSATCTSRKAVDQLLLAVQSGGKAAVKSLMTFTN